MPGRRFNMKNLEVGDYVKYILYTNKTGKDVCLTGEVRKILNSEKGSIAVVNVFPSN